MNSFIMHTIEAYESLGAFGSDCELMQFRDSFMLNESVAILLLNLAHVFIINMMSKKCNLWERYFNVSNYMLT